MEPENDKDNIIAWTISIIVHILVLIILYVTVLRTIVPEEDSGILVSFGNIYASTGQNEPRPSASVPQKEIPPPQPKSKTSDEKLITQNEEETVVIPDKKKQEKEDKAAQEKARKEAEERRRAEDERLRRDKQQQQQENISNLANKAFGQGSSDDTQQGEQAVTTETTGKQGNPFGNATQGATTGAGGFGTFNLNGRSIGGGGLPRPEYNSQQEGKIVINITVDPSGNVILATISVRGTNIDDSSLRQSALNAARRAKFNKIQSTNNQTGTITYNYKYIN